MDDLESRSPSKCDFISLAGNEFTREQVGELGLGLERAEQIFERIKVALQQFGKKYGPKKPASSN